VEAVEEVVGVALTLQAVLVEAVEVVVPFAKQKFH
jgi:hypothetical protein